jgi:PAS domain S-box-containing protein
MNAAIRLLHLEDDPLDAERLRLRLQADHPACEIVWVRGKEDFESSLQAQAFDVVICNYELPGYSGLQALRHVREQQPELPVIISSSGLRSEEDAVECMKAGATDYVLKQRPWRLGAQVRRALIEKEERAALRRAEEDLRALNAELEERVRSRTAELETANSFLNSVIQHIPHMVIVKNVSDLTFVRVNRSFERVSGFSEQDVLGKTAYDIAARKEEADYFTASDKQVLALGQELDIPAAMRHTREGELRFLHLKKIPIRDDAGQPRYVLTIAEDVTEKTKKEREVERLNEALAQRTTEVEAANRAKSTFLATMSHEIRTPMNGMLGMLELLSLTDLDAEQRETLGLVRASSKSLLRIIDDILDFSKIEAGKLDIRPEVVSIRQVIEEVQSIYLGNASSKGLIVRRMVDPRISPALWADPVRLRQILNNFVSNAIKFTPAGSIEISAQWVGRADGQESLRFVVRDTGIGISQEDQQRLFQPFSQALGDRNSGGAGLGLVISRQLAQMMGGTISLESEPGKGTTLILSLSLPIDEALPDSGAQSARALPPAIPARRTAPSIAQAETEGTLVLLVDDHPVNRMLLLRQVQTLGYAAQTAEHGIEALEKWKSGRFGLVITDCHMPQMDGYELARSIRSLESAEDRKRVPIIACTANALQGEAEACRAAGMDDYLVKPVELSQLTDKLEQWLPVPQEPAPPAAAAAAAGQEPDTAPSVAPIDQALLTATCGGDAPMMGEVLATFRRTCDEDAAGLEEAVTAGDVAQVTLFAHRMGGAGKMVGAFGFAAACEHIDRASRAGDWKAVLAGMPAFERERMRLAAYFKSREETA